MFKVPKSLRRSRQRFTILGNVSDDLEALLERARDGDGESLERLVEQIQRPIYNLALRMLWHPEDARHATRDILVRVITHLGSFRGESRVPTWVFRIAANYLTTARRSRVEAAAYTFDRFANELRDGLADFRDAEAWPRDKALLLEEVKVGCMRGLLTCLDRPHRLAYILRFPRRWKSQAPGNGAANGSA